MAAAILLFCFQGANILPWSAAGHRPSWRPIAGKALCLRCEAPTFCPGAQPVTGRVGAPLLAKPCASVARRQHFALERSRAPPKLAPHCRQNLVPPLRGANILPWSAARTPAELAPHCRQSIVPPLQDANILPWPSSRPPKNNKKTSNLSCSSVVRDQGFEPWTP